MGDTNIAGGGGDHRSIGIGRSGSTNRSRTPPVPVRNSSGRQPHRGPALKVRRIVDASTTVWPWSRRRFIGAAIGMFLGGGFPAVTAGSAPPASRNETETTLFLCGDVMTGRGMDQILPHPCDRRIYEEYMTSAAGYVELAERANGPIPKPAAFSYPWGDALEALEHYRPEHPKAMEVHRGRLILYGCGDFLNDYEGIGGYEAYRADLVLMYLPRLSGRDGRLLELKLVPFRIRNFRLNHTLPEESGWLSATLDRECRRFGGRVGPAADGTLELAWD